MAISAITRRKRQAAAAKTPQLGPDALASLALGTEQSLCQAKVPTPLFAAVREQLDKDGLTLRQMMRWALVEYLRIRNPDQAESILRQVV